MLQFAPARGRETARDSLIDLALIDRDAEKPPLRLASDWIKHLLWVGINRARRIGAVGGKYIYIYRESVVICRRARSVFWSPAWPKPNPVPCCNSHWSMLLKHLATACNKLPTNSPGKRYTAAASISQEGKRSRGVGGGYFFSLWFYFWPPWVDEWMKAEYITGRKDWITTIRLFLPEHLFLTRNAG